MKSIMQSIRPKWCELIAYCTKDEPLYHSGEKFYIKEAGEFGNSKVIGEYICDSLIQIGYNQNGYGLDDSAINGVLAKSCMSEKELYRYLKGAKPNLYHISELVIYDKPKELGEFYTYCAGKGNETDKLCLNCSHLCFDNDLINGYSRWCDVYGRKPLTRAPQDWFYVEELR